jgi:hypothetical protein
MSLCSDESRIWLGGITGNSWKEHGQPRRTGAWHGNGISGVRIGCGQADDLTAGGHIFCCDYCHKMLVRLRYNERKMYI